MPATDEALLRLPARLVAESEAILSALGLSTDEAVRLFLTQVSLRRGLPFPVALPGSESAACADDDLLAAAHVRQAVLDSFYDDQNDAPLV